MPSEIAGLPSGWRDQIMECKYDTSAPELIIGLIQRWIITTPEAPVAPDPDTAPYWLTYYVHELAVGMIVLVDGVPKAVTHISISESEWAADPVLSYDDGTHEQFARIDFVSAYQPRKG